MPADTTSRREVGGAPRAADVAREIERSLRQRRALDPRAQILILVMMNLLATTPTPALVDIAGVVSAAAVLAYGRRWASALRWLCGYALIWALASLCAASADPLLVSVGAVLMMMRKIYVIAMFASNMIASIRVGELACALQRLHVPRLAIVAVSVVLRFLPTLAAEASAVVDAMKLRGVRLSASRVARRPLAMLEFFAVPLILRVSVVTDEISRAATVRGIDSSHTRTSLYEMRMGWADWLFLAWFAALSIASVVLAGDAFTFMGLF